MKQYDHFGEYMFDLLFAPLKKGKRAVNQFFIFFKVIGRVFDGLKEDALRVRDETNIATASPVMLPVHGQDRNMPRLAGESVEGYRTRLAMKGIIAEKGGLKDGILYALAALGYEQSTIEPFAFQDPERWAEFIVFLKGSQQSGVNDLNVIDAEVCKVKEGSSKPAYGSEAGAVIEIGSELITGYSHYPRCNEIVCGVWPHIASIGHLTPSPCMRASPPRRRRAPNRETASCNIPFAPRGSVAPRKPTRQEARETYEQDDHSGRH